MEQEKEKYLNKFVKIYPYLKGATDDLLFFIAIDSLFYTVAKGLSAQQIVFLTTISSFFSIFCRMILVRLIRKIGNTNSVRLGIGLLLLSAIVITFAPSYFWVIAGKFIYEIAWVFKDMEHIMLKNNLTVLGKEEQYVKIANKGMVVYAFLTLIVAISSGFLFNISPYLPMYLCITICAVAFIVYFFMKDVSKYNITVKENSKPKKVKLSKVIWIILISYAMFYGAVTSGQYNSKLLIQYELSDIFDMGKVSIYLGVIVTISRISRLLGSMVFGKIYYKIKNKSLILLTTMLFAAFVFISTGFFVKVTILKFILMTTGFCLILAVRDPFRLYTNDIVLELSKPEEQQVVVSYIQFARKVGTTICSLVCSAILLKWEMVYVIMGIGILALAEVLTGLKLYSILSSNNNNSNQIANKEGEKLDETICN